MRVTDIRSDFQSDVWSEWLRHADDPAFADVVRAEVERYADRVLDAARLAPGMTLADIGAGEGLIAFRAIDRIGHTLRVLIADVSAPMLRHAESLAIQRQVKNQCTFLQCPADRLDDIPDASVDVVTTRAVLAYVSDKSAALREFHRVLKPGGRISIAEPILQDEALVATAHHTLGPHHSAPFLSNSSRLKSGDCSNNSCARSSNPPTP
jgi:arsenite methyltransferase